MSAPGQRARRDYGPVQLADYLRACWPDLRGSVDRARHFGLLPEPDRARGRWSAALAEAISAKWPETAAASQCIGAYGLKERGWSESMIRDLLGEPDLYADNPHCKTAAPMRLWRVRRAEAAEAAPGFAAARERAERQCAAAAKAAETRAVFKALAGSKPVTVRLSDGSVKGAMKIRLHGTEEECREGLQLLEQVMLVQSVRGPYQDRQRNELERSVLVRVCVEAIPRRGR